LVCESRTSHTASGPLQLQYIVVQAGSAGPRILRELPPAQVIGSRATDVILFSVEPAPDGTIAHQDRLPPDELKKARAARDAHGVRLAACVGGAGRSSHFGLVKNPALRKRFGRALLAFAEVEQLDSLDIDWEGQVGEEEDEALAKLLGGIRKAAKKTLPQLTVSVTVHPGDYYAKSFKVASFVHLMSYDSCAAPGVTCRHATFDTAKSHVQVRSEHRREPPHSKSGLSFAYGSSLTPPPNTIGSTRSACSPRAYRRESWCWGFPRTVAA
jgi:hypothetical protein